MYELFVKTAQKRKQFPPFCAAARGLTRFLTSSTRLALLLGTATNHDPTYARRGQTNHEETSI